MEQMLMRIGDDWRAGEEQFVSRDPFTTDEWALIPEATERDVGDAVAAARTTFEATWRLVPGAERGRLLHRLADLIEERHEELAILETRDNGKLLRETRDQVRMVAGWYRYFAGLCDKLEGRVIETGRSNYFGMTSVEPIGVVAAVLPWNSPLLLLTFKAAPALAAGCTIVAKPSEHASASVLAFARLFDDAGFPPGVFNTVSGASRDVGRWLTESGHIDRVCFTGSTDTGRKVAQSAASHLASFTLELGGKSPNIVFDDAGIDEAVNGLLAGIFGASGQTCLAGSRALVHDAIYDEVLERLVTRTETILLGDPKEAATEMAPIAIPEHVERIDTFVRDAIVGGATVATGGKRSGQHGQFYEPTILTDIESDAVVCQEEIFGPVLALMRFASEEDAVAIANDSRYGLAAGVWTQDLRRAFRVASVLHVGTVWVNGYRTLTQSMPFGGVGESGVGSENGQMAIRDFLREKAVWIELEGRSRDPFTVG